MFRQYYQLTKPGIIYGNLLTATAGFFLASRGHLQLILLIAVLGGTSLVIASACVFNNYIDRSIDKAMNRTKTRALVTGLIPARHALVYATILGILGFFVLILYTNLLVVLIGAVGYIDYLLAYGFLKRRSTWSTLVGSVAGATPPVAGYCAVAGRFDTGALLLFLILAFWQMSHFYAIAIYRKDEYASASLPVLPVKKGNLVTKYHMLVYMIGFTIAALLLPVLGYAGYFYLAVVTVLSAIWLWLCLEGLRTNDDRRWARMVFSFSLIVISGLSLAISINAMLYYNL